MINENMIEAQRMIQEVVKSRFESLYDCKDAEGNFDPNVVNTPVDPWFKTDPQ